MIIDYSKRGTLCQAIAQTFDGAHPCSLCHIVNKGKSAEKKSDLQLLDAETRSHLHKRCDYTRLALHLFRLRE